MRFSADDDISPDFLPLLPRVLPRAPIPRRPNNRIDTHRILGESISRSIGDGCLSVRAPRTQVRSPGSHILFVVWGHLCLFRCKLSRAWLLSPLEPLARPLLSFYTSIQHAHGRQKDNDDLIGAARASCQLAVLHSTYCRSQLISVPVRH